MVAGGTMMAKKKVTNNRWTEYEVSDIDFVRTWQKSLTLDQVSEQLGIPKSICSGRASWLRQKGTRLKPMPRRPNSAIDINELNAIIDEIDKSGENPSVTSGIISEPDDTPANEEQLKRMKEQIEKLQREQAKRKK